MNELFPSPLSPQIMRFIFSFVFCTRRDTCWGRRISCSEDCVVAVELGLLSGGVVAQAVSEESIETALSKLFKESFSRKSICLAGDSRLGLPLDMGSGRKPGADQFLSTELLGGLRLWSFVGEISGREYCLVSDENNLLGE